MIMKKTISNSGHPKVGETSEVISVSEDTFRRFKQAIDEKDDWIRKVQSGELTYTKGKTIG